jgi:hypothetical protein
MCPKLLINKAKNFAFIVYPAGSVYMSENLWANELHNKDSFDKVLL